MGRKAKRLKARLRQESSRVDSFLRRYERERDRAAGLVQTVDIWKRKADEAQALVNRLGLMRWRHDDKIWVLERAFSELELSAMDPKFLPEFAKMLTQQTLDEIAHRWERQHG